MSEDKKSASDPGWRALRLLVRVLLYGFLALILMAALRVQIEVPFILILGWVSFLIRTIPRITWNWDLMGMAVVCMVLILVAGQWLLNWISQSVQKARSPGVGDGHWRWPWKLTWSGLIAVGLFFLVGMSVGGIAHQIGWMVSSTEPMRGKKPFRGEYLSDMRQLEGAWEQAALETKGNLKEIQTLLWGGDNLLRGDSGIRLKAKYHLLLIVEPDQKVRGAIIFPRDPRIRDKVGFIYSFNNEERFQPIKNLDAIIARHRSQLVAI